MTDPRCILQSERLRLREFTPDDAAFIRALVNDPDWRRHISQPDVGDDAAAREWIQTRLVDPCRRQGYGLWAVERRDDGTLIGMCGFVRRDTLPGVDIGYALAPEARGHGYVVEAVRACLEHGRTELGFGRVLAITSPDNEASQRVLLAVGMRFLEQKVLPGNTVESRVYAWDPAGD